MATRQRAYLHQENRRAGTENRNQAGRPASRTRILLLSAAVLLAVAGWTWREPAELWLLRRGPVEGLERYAKTHPDSVSGVTTLAEAYLGTGRAQSAVEVLEPVQSRFPENAPLRVLLARALLESGRTADAYAHLQVVLNEVDPRNAEARFWLGKVLESSGRTNEAYDQYEALVRQQPRHAEALVRLGVIAERDGRYTKAEEHYRAATAADPRNPEAHARLAETAFRLGKAGEAEQEARRALKLTPDEPRASFWLGRALMTLDPQAHAAEAEAAFRKTIAAGMEEYTARYYLAKLYQGLGRTADAVKELEASIREHPMHKDAFYDLALCQRARGHTAAADRAMAQFRKINAIDEEGTVLEYQVWSQPGKVPPMLALIRHYLKNRRPDLARPFVNQILRQNPNHAEARRLAAEIAAHPEPL